MLTYGRFDNAVDVVPVEPSTIDQWLHPPYSGYYDGKDASYLRAAYPHRDRRQVDMGARNLRR